MRDKAYVYLLTIGGKGYVGVTVHPKERYYQHISALRKNKHPNKRMQMAYNEAGGDFEYEILEEVPHWLDIQYELDWIYRLETYLTQRGFNDKDPRIMSYKTGKYTQPYWERMNGDHLKQKWYRDINKKERMIFNKEVILLGTNGV